MCCHSYYEDESLKGSENRQGLVRTAMKIVSFVFRSCMRLEMEKQKIRQKKN